MEVQIAAENQANNEGKLNGKDGGGEPQTGEGSKSPRKGLDKVSILKDMQMKANATFYRESKDSLF